MSWGIQFTSVIHIKATINSHSDIDVAINDIQETLNSTETALNMMAVANPKTLLREDESDIIAEVQYRISVLMEDYRDQVRDLTKLYLLKQLVEDDKDFDFTKIVY